MSQSPPPADPRDDRPPVSESELAMPAAGSADPAWQPPGGATPASPDASDGRLGQTVPPQSAPGHYGPGYADPTRHYGGTGATPDPAGGAPASPAGGTPAPAEHSRAADDEQPTQDPERPPDFRSDEVGVRPPDHAPSPSAPESENAGLIFERS